MLLLHFTFQRAPVAFVRRPPRYPRAQARRLPIWHRRSSAQFPLLVAWSVHLAEFQHSEPPTVLLLHFTFQRAPVAFVRRPPRLPAGSSSPVTHLHRSSAQFPLLVAWSVHLAEFQAPEPPTALLPAFHHFRGRQWRSYAALHVTAGSSSPVTHFASADRLGSASTTGSLERAPCGISAPGAADSAPPGFHHFEGASGVRTPPSTFTAGSSSPVTHFASADSLGPASTTGSLEHAPCGISAPGAADSAPPGFHQSEGASGASAPPSTFTAGSSSPVTHFASADSLGPASTIGSLEHATCGIPAPGVADGAPPGIHASGGASGAQAPPSLTSGGVRPATQLRHLSAKVAASLAAPPSRAEGAQSPLPCFAVVTHSSSRAGGCPAARIQTKATGTFPNGLVPEAGSLEALGLHPLIHALTALQRTRPGTRCSVTAMSTATRPAWRPSKGNPSLSG